MQSKNSLVNNINRRKQSGTSRSKEDSTVSRKAYNDMRDGWPKLATKKVRGAAEQPVKDPKPGLTAAGHAAFKRKEGANLKPGVQGPADTPDKMRRKGSFLRRTFTNPRGPMLDEKGNPTRLALSAHAWGETVPKTPAAAKKLAAKVCACLNNMQSTNQSKRGGFRCPARTNGSL